MAEYKILWKMEGENAYFSLVTRTAPRFTEMHREEGGIFNHLYHSGSGEILDWRFIKQLRPFAEADPATVYLDAQALGAEVVLGEFDLLMDESQAARLEDLYKDYNDWRYGEKRRDAIKLIRHSLRNPIEVHVSLKHKEVPEYQEV